MTTQNRLWKSKGSARLNGACFLISCLTLLSAAYFAFQPITLQTFYSFGVLLLICCTSTGIAAENAANNEVRL